mmetsp:Transcript_51079/g.131717  ORF Transcript_51079/g.131717 Transcript_51079/m.131717 type:complete len:235 (-) Transcript_51079:3294-3998(-)
MLEESEPLMPSALMIFTLSLPVCSFFSNATRSSRDSPDFVSSSSGTSGKVQDASMKRWPLQSSSFFRYLRASGRVLEPSSSFGGGATTSRTNCFGCGVSWLRAGSQHSPRKSSLLVVSWSQISNSTRWRTFTASRKSSSSSWPVGSAMETSSFNGGTGLMSRMRLSVVVSLRSVSLSSGLCRMHVTNSAFVTDICTLPERSSWSISTYRSAGGKWPSPSTWICMFWRMPSPART